MTFSPLTVINKIEETVMTSLFPQTIPMQQLRTLVEVPAELLAQTQVDSGTEKTPCPLPAQVALALARSRKDGAQRVQHLDRILRVIS